MKEMYLLTNDIVTYVLALTAAHTSAYKFRFPNNIIPSFEEAKNYYHKNSKLLLHLFYNEITGKHEMQLTTKAVSLSYPQNKKINVRGFDAKTFCDTLTATFGKI